MTSTVLVTGGSRGIGRAVSEVLNVRGWQVLAPSRQELDLADPSSVGAFLSSLTTKVDGPHPPKQH